MVPRPLPLRAAVASAVLAVALGSPLGAGPLGPAPAAADDGADVRTDHRGTTVPADYDAPLLVTIDELTPGEVPDRGPVVVSGTVINRDLETWTGVNLYPFVNAGDCAACPAPITTTAELAVAAEVEPETLVGNRVVDVSATIDALAPGEVATYTIRVPRRLLPVSSPGIYWFGVHALGASASSPDDAFADGRARTFLPYLPRGRDGVRGSVDLAVVVPLRSPVRHRRDGRIARPRDWVEALGPNGVLGGPLAFGSAAGAQAVTWLVDPAVPDAVRSLRRGNLPRDLGPAPDDADADEPGDDGTGGGDGGGGENGDGDGDGENASPTDGTTDGTTEGPEPAAAEHPVVQLAGEWLDAAEILLRDEEVLTLPYGDLDMSAAPEWKPDLYPLSRELSGEVLRSWEIDTMPVVASPGGYLDPAALPAIDDDSTLLVTDRMFDPATFPAGPPPAGAYDDHAILATSYGAATGGPGPEPRLSPVAFRQRLLAEAALRVLAPGRTRPLVVTVPRTVDTSGAASFWSGLEADWLDLTTIQDVLERPAEPLDPEDLVYPMEQESAELDSTVFYEADRLAAAGRTLQNVLVEGGPVAPAVQAEALAGTSYYLRGEATAAADRLQQSRRWIDRRLGKVGIDGPPAVTLSSADGSFAVTVSNRLDRPVTVRIGAESPGDEVTVDVGEPVVLAARSRTTVLLDAHTRGPGVHNVTLFVTDTDGTPLGSSVEVPVRSGQVSEIIWVILGVGFGILVFAIALRLYRRIRGVSTGSTTKKEGSTTDEPVPPDDEPGATTRAGASPSATGPTTDGGA